MLGLKNNVGLTFRILELTGFSLTVVCGGKREL